MMTADRVKRIGGRLSREDIFMMLRVYAAILLLILALVISSQARIGGEPSTDATHMNASRPAAL